MGRLEEEQAGEGILGVIFGQIRTEVPIKPPSRGVEQQVESMSLHSGEKSYLEIKIWKSEAYGYYLEPRKLMRLPAEKK